MENIERLDATLVSLAREEGALRLRLGQHLEVLGRGAAFELGFSSLGAYGVERCERSVRWLEAARCLARRVEALPELRRAISVGKVSWSMGEVLARVATPADEERWLALAESHTVRQVRESAEEIVCAARARGTTRTKARAVRLVQPAVNPQDAAGGALGPWPTGDADADADADADDICTLTCTVDREDAWLFEATRCLLDQLGERGTAAQMEALLAEAQGTLLASLPPGAVDASCWQGVDSAQQRWVEQLRRWRAQAEVACEQSFLGGLAGARAASLAEGLSPHAVAASLGIAPLEHASCILLDREVRSLSSALARHELELSELVLRFHRADGWRRLGYATETQYARERLGLSRSGLAARRALALRLERLPRVAAALGAAQIGVEAALQLVRIATPKTEAAWVRRASRRTIKHLREEVAAALVAVRLAGESDCPPPEESELAAFQTLEQGVVSGRFGQSQLPDHIAAPVGSAPSVGECRLVEPPSESRRTWRVMLGSLVSWLAGGLQMSAAPSRLGAARTCSFAGRVALRLRVSRDTFAWWRGLEAQARRWLPCGMSWLRFLCLSLWQSWHHLLGTDAAYGHIYIRDRFRCTSPVCNRHDVTPHHIQFRSAGGSDEVHNLTSPCSWCHLLGVHGGRLRASGTAEHIRWELGPRNAPCLVINGRERIVA
jgi:hypothetical protein